MKLSSLKQGVVTLALIFSFLMVPVKAHAHYDFLVTAGRMIFVVPTAVVRASAFFVEGVIDGVLEGIFNRKGFLHGESPYITSG